MLCARLPNHANPNCDSRTKTPGSPWVDNHYNECGYRGPRSCRQTAPGPARIAFLGSSFALGYFVPYPQTLAANTERRLSEACGHPVEVQNLAAFGSYGPRLIANTREAVSLKPSAIVYTVNAFDLKEYADNTDTNVSQDASAKKFELLKIVKSLADKSTLLYMIGDFQVQSDDFFINLYARNGDKADFMRSPLSPAWQSNIATFDRVIRDMGLLAQSQNIPFIVLYAPERVQAAITGSPRRFAGLDPLLLPTILRKISQKYGAHFIDATQDIPKARRAAPCITPTTPTPMARDTRSLPARSCAA